MALTTDFKGAKAVVSGNCDLLGSVGKADQQPPVVSVLERLPVTSIKTDGPIFSPRKRSGIRFERNHSRV